MPTAAITTNRLGQHTEFLRTSATPAGENPFGAYAGRFSSEELGVTYDIRATQTGIAVGIASPQARLPFAFLHGDPLELTSVLPHWFVSGAFALRFIPDDGGRIVRLRVSHERARNIEFVRER